MEDRSFPPAFGSINQPIIPDDISVASEKIKQKEVMNKMIKDESRKFKGEEKKNKLEVLNSFLKKSI